MDLFLENLSDPSYKESTRFLYDLQYSGIKLGLKNIEAFLEHLGNPQKKLKTIHIAGTNGKGSTAAILESIFIEAGYQTGCYTSPHLISFQERMRINRRMIDIDFIDRFVKTHRETITRLNLTFFEATTGLAFQYFAQQNPDILIVECGLGGRLDSTNVIHSPLSIITKIALDHQPYLGDTLEKISREKAGIIFEGSELFTSSKNRTALQVIEERCRAVNAAYCNIHDISTIELKNNSMQGITFSYYSQNYILRDLKIPLFGMHQLENAKLAISAVLHNQTYKVTPEQITRGLAAVLWPGRLQLLQSNPFLLLDAGHNPDGFNQSLKAVKKCTRGKLHVVCGIVDDKNSKEIAEIVESYSDAAILAGFESRRQLAPEKFKTSFKNNDNVSVSKESAYKTVQRLLETIDKNDTLLVIGSHYLIGEFLHEGLKAKKEFASYYQTT